jgi:hypothetical protein
LIRVPSSIARADVADVMVEACESTQWASRRSGWARPLSSAGDALRMARQVNAAAHAFCGQPWTGRAFEILYPPITLSNNPQFGLCEDALDECVAHAQSAIEPRHADLESFE